MTRPEHTTVADLLNKHRRSAAEAAPEAIPMTMKIADPQEVTALMTKVIQEFTWSDDTLREHAGELVHDIALALAQGAYFVIQPDMPTAAGD